MKAREKIYRINLFFYCVMIYFSFFPNTHIAQNIETTALDTVTIQLKFFHQFQFAGFYTAKEKGFYKEEGLYVKIEEGTRNISPREALLTEKAQYAVQGGGIIVSRSRGFPVVIVKPIFQYSPLVFISLKSSGIRNPRDFSGKKLMASAGTELKGMLRNVGVSENSIILVEHTWNYNDLLSGKVDVMSAHATTQPYFFISKGYEANIIDPRDYGINDYGDMIITSEKEIKNNPERVEAFTRASLKGWEYALENQDEIIDFILSLKSERTEAITREQLEFEAKQTKKYILPDLIAVGHLNPDRIQSMIQIRTELGLLERPVTLDEMIFIPEEERPASNWTITLILLGGLLIGLIVTYLLVIQLRKVIRKKTALLKIEIEERKQREIELYHTNESLKKIEIRNKALLNSIPDSIFRISRDGIYLDYHPPRDRELSVKPEDLIGRNIADILPIDIAKVGLEKIRNAINSNKLQFMEYELVVNNRKRFFESRVYPSEKDEVTVIVRESTDRILNEEKLEFSEQRFSKIFKVSPSAIVISSVKEGKIIDVNDSYTLYTGYKKEETIGKLAKDLNLWSDLNDRKKFTELLKTNGYVKNYEAKFHRKDGSDFYCLVSAEIIKINGEDYILGNYHDITQLKEKEILLSETLTEVENLKAQLQRENIYLREEISREYNYHNILTKNKEYRKVLSQIDEVASTDSTVLIYGETGTGKELIARAVHEISNRRDKPLVKVNCASLPATLIESELFGHEKGAFTGADKSRTGRFELADKGTIFLDEIGELPIELQSKLLRVIQEKEFEKLGSDKTISVDVRIIAATNRDLRKLIQEGRFREDLYFRLNVFPIKTIPLRKRKEDIPLLTQLFIKQISSRIGKEIEKIDQQTMNLLDSYDWPGNVRELQNILERGIISSKDNILTIDSSFLPVTPKSSPELMNKNTETEERRIRSALIESDWKIEGNSGAAELLNMAPSTLRDKMKKYDIQRPS